MVGEQIRLNRKKKNLTQQGLAALLYVSQQAVGKWERNESTPNPETIAKMAEIFGITTDLLINGVESSQQKERTAAPKSDGLSPEDARIMDLLRRLSPENKRKFAESLEALSEPPVQAPDDQA